MQFQDTPYIVPLLVSSLIAGFVAYYGWQRRTTVSGGTALALLALACAEWSIAYALEIAGIDLSTKLLWGKVQYIGIAAVPLLWILFAYSYATSSSSIPRQHVRLLAIVPLVTLLLVFTNERHGLIWRDTEIRTSGTFSALDVTHGSWFWVYWIYANILVFLGTLFILRSFNRTKGLFRRQNIILLIAVLTPWVGNILYVSGLSPIPHLDTTPFAFTISIVVFAWGISSFKLVDLAPVARDVVVEKMPDGMIVLDAQGNIVDINPAVQKALGLSDSQAIGQKARDVFHAWPHLVDRYESLSEAQDEIVFGEGESQAWYELRMSPLKDSRNRLLGRVLTVRDITEKKQIGEALRLSEEKYREIYENVADIIYQTDNHSYITSISPSVEKLGGYKPEELIGRSVTEFFVFPEQYAALDTLILENGFVNDFEAVLRTKDGKDMFVSITSHIIFDANGQGIATEGVLRDITERKQADERIRQMNAELENRVIERTSQLQEINVYLSSLIETSIALNESLDLNEVLDRILVQANKLIPARAFNIMLVEAGQASIVRRFGYKGLEKIEQELLNLRFPLSWHTFKLMHTSAQSILMSDTTQEPGWQTIHGLEWVRSYIGVPLIISDEVIGFLNANHSEPNFFNHRHRLMLESLAHHASVAIQNARLLDELKKALEKEQRMRNQLVQADKLAILGKMVSVIAHEINNPIQTVKNTFYLLEDQIPPGSPAGEYLKIASAEANRIADLVKQLRGTYASGSQEWTRVDVLALLMEVHELLAPQLKKNQVEWCQLNGTVPYTVFAVHNSLKQVFLNLCLNAMEAMETDQGGKLTIDLHTTSNGQNVAVNFHNSGPLISKDTLPHIFDPFFTTKKNGTGLGLSISYDILRQHQGEILVESEPERGVTFTVLLPVVTNEEDEGAE